MTGLVTLTVKPAIFLTNPHHLDLAPVDEYMANTFLLFGKRPARIAEIYILFEYNLLLGGDMQGVLGLNFYYF